MQGVKNIIFDLGGVLLNLDNQRTEDAFTALGVKNFREYFGHGFAASFFKDYEVGRIDDRQFIDSVRALTGVSASDRAIAHETRHRSLASLDAYIRVENAWTDNAATILDL